MPSTAALCLLLVATPCLVAGGRTSVQLEDDANALAVEEDTGAQVRARAGTNASQDTRVEASRREGTNVSQLTKWNLFGEGGPKMTDVKQGHLGNCYLLAVLAAIANTHPEKIEDAFIMQGQTSQDGRKVYQLRFLLDGVDTIVAVDELVPVSGEKSPSGKFFFADTNDGDDIWPILMEKGWAKLFGSYLATEIGGPAQTFRAITQAPLTFITATMTFTSNSWQDPEKLWNGLREGIYNNFPMVANSAQNSVGVKPAHGFAVVGLSKDTELRVVKVYNPYAFNEYTGALKTDTSNEHGAFSLTFEEFQEVFPMVFVAHVRKGYRVNFDKIHKVPTGEPLALKFTVRKEGPFAVQMEWPTPRFVNVHGCRLDVMHAKLMIRKEGSDDWKSAGRNPASSLFVELHGSGTYLLYAFVSFPGAPVISQVLINVYSEEDVDLQAIQRPPLDVGREIMGRPCKFLVSGSDIYEAMPYPVGGSPAWKKSSSKEVIWVNELGEVTRAPSLEKLDTNTPAFPLEELECRDEVDQLDMADDMPEEKREVVYTACGFSLGERVEYKPEYEWICADIENLSDEKKLLQLRHHTVKTEILSCLSEKLRKVPQCPWEEEDEVEFYNDEGQWVKDRIKEVLCGKVLLESWKLVDCGQDNLRYPHSCPFHNDESVIVRNDRLEEWRFTGVAEVAPVEGDKAVVRIDEELAIPCDDHDRLRKLTRCEKLTHDQINRLSRLNNVDEILQGTDEEFPPNRGSIGSQSICDRRCDLFNNWHAVSGVLH